MGACLGHLQSNPTAEPATMLGTLLVLNVGVRLYKSRHADRFNYTERSQWHRQWQSVRRGRTKGIQDPIRATWNVSLPIHPMSSFVSSPGYQAAQLSEEQAQAHDTSRNNSTVYVP